MQKASSLHEVVKSHWFARLDVFLVILSGAAWIFFPEYVGAAPLLFLVLPWIVRFAAKEFPFRRTLFDWMMLIFLITVWVGYWASYDKASALNKAWLLTTSVFLYFALSSQPEENMLWMASVLFAVGVGVSLYFFFTHNFIEEPRKVELLNKIGVLWMNIRPQVLWPLIHPNYVSGVAALTGVFGLYPLRKSSQSILVRLGILAGFFVIFFALVMATSRGIWMALGGVIGLWLLWRYVELNGGALRLRKEALFPILTFAFLGIVIAILYLGPAQLPSSLVGSPDYGVGSRAELFSRSLYFVGDYPITGGGLAAFPGLYSEYILDIPYFYVVNSHNLFLDVFIEQGIFGGIVFLLFYLVCIWRVSSSIVQAQSSELRFMQWVVLGALVIAFIHGMVDDYLYNAKGSIFSLLLIGLSMAVTKGYAPVLHLVLPRKYALSFGVGFLVLVGFAFNTILAMWYADLGAVQLAKVELRGFPETGWTGPEIAIQFKQADASLHAALQLDPDNRTANHRLGLISIIRQDFSSAVVYLNIAHTVSPKHRGIVKSLGFGYAWLGKTDNAVSSLKEIPETKNELDSYCIWWKKQGRSDLWANAIKLHQKLESMPVQQ